MFRSLVTRSPAPTGSTPLEAIRQRGVPIAGDAIVYNRYIYYHSALYLGKGVDVLARGQLLIDASKRACEDANKELAAAYERIFLENSIDPQKHYIIHYVPPDGWGLFDKLRHGLSRSFTVKVMEYHSVKRKSNTFIVSRPSWIGCSDADSAIVCQQSLLNPLQERRINMAIRSYGSQLGGYDFFFNNCQHFVTHAAFGRGALYPWTLIQLSLFTVLAVTLIGTAVCFVEERFRKVEVDNTGKVADHSVFWRCVALSSAMILAVVIWRHGMLLRLTKCLDPM